MGFEFLFKLFYIYSNSWNNFGNRKTKSCCWNFNKKFIHRSCFRNRVLTLFSEFTTPGTMSLQLSNEKIKKKNYLTYLLCSLDKFSLRQANIQYQSKYRFLKKISKNNFLSLWQDHFPGTPVKALGTLREQAKGWLL